MVFASLPVSDSFVTVKKSQTLELSRGERGEGGGWGRGNHRKSDPMIYADRIDSDQPAHLCSLIRVYPSSVYNL